MDDLLYLTITKTHYFYAAVFLIAKAHCGSY